MEDFFSVKFGTQETEPETVTQTQTQTKLVNNNLVEIVEPYEGIQPIASIELVTVDDAQSYLTNQIENNRNINERRVSEYLRRMKNGEWKVSQALEFNTDGMLYNGQHRLTAQVRFNKPLYHTIIRNMPVSAADVSDLGQSRNASQIASLSGYGHLTRHFSIIRKLLAYSGYFSSASPQTLINLALRYKDGLDFALRHYKNAKGLTVNYTIHAAIVKAYYYEDPEKLAQFLYCFCTGFSLKDELKNEMVQNKEVSKDQKKFDMTAIATRNLYLEKKNQELADKYNAKVTIPQSVQRNLHGILLRRTVNGISYFCRKRCLINIIEPITDVYPLIDFLPAHERDFKKKDGAATYERIRRFCELADPTKTTLVLQ